MRQRSVLPAAALVLLSVGLMGVVAIVLVAQETSGYLGSSSSSSRSVQATGGLGRASVQQLRSRLLQEPGVQRRLWRLARQSQTVEEFSGRLQQSGLVLGTVAGEDGQQPGSIIGSSSSREGGAGGSSSDGSESGAGTDGQQELFSSFWQRSQEAESSSSSSSGSGSSRSSGGIGSQEIQPLSRQLAQTHSQDNIIIVTWANYHFSDFALNWGRNLRQQGINNFLIGAMDLETAQVLGEHQLPVFAMFDVGKETSTGLTKGDFIWGSPTFHKMGRQKVELARLFTSYGLDLCLCDVDTVWISDPTSYFEQFPEADILASSDQLLPTVKSGDTGLEDPHAIHSALNIGLLYFRHGPNTTRFLEGWHESLEKDDKTWDQNAFNWLVHEGLQPFRSHPSNPRLLWAYKGSVVVGVLPVASFASGHTFFVQKLFQVQKVQPYVVHTTFQYGGTYGKRNRMREAMLWVDDPAYYADGKFLSVDLQTPPVPKDFDDWADTKMQDYHLTGMEMQLRQLKAAFGLAVALNRTIVMPKLLCFCDRYWGPVERCRVPGAVATRLPFVCPMDHILEPFHFDSHPGKGGPLIRYREYSFLDNDHTPSALKESRVLVTPDKSLTQPEVRTKGKEVVVPTGGTDKQLRDWLSIVQEVQLLHLTSLHEAFGGFASPADSDSFQRRLGSMMGFWCCRQVKAGEDGGVRYASLLPPK